MGLLFTTQQDKVLRFFLQYPSTEVHLRELSRKTKVSHPWVCKTVKELLKRGIVVSRKAHGLLLVKADRESSRFLALKRCLNLYSLTECGLVEYLVESYGRPAAIVLFGSYSRGEDIEQSDIDIAVITDRKLNLEYARFEKPLQRHIRVVELKAGDIGVEFRNTLSNGIVLYGYLQ